MTLYPFRLNIFALIVPLILASQPLNEQPPLTVTGYLTDADYYFTVDVETGASTRIERTGPGKPITGTFYGYVLPPQQIPFQSPYDPSHKFMLIDESDPDTEVVEDGYSLFRVETDGEMTKIAEAAWTGEYQYWSPDGRFLYILIINSSNFPILYQYWLETGEFVETTGREKLISCDPANLWCVFFRQADNHQQIWLFNKNSLQIRLVDETPLDSQFAVQWERDRPELLYVVHTDTLAVRSYHYQADTHETLAELPQSRFYEMARSPDGRWLALFVGDSDSQRDIVLVDLQSEDRQPTAVTGGDDVGGGVSQFSLEWSEAEGVLLFGMQRNGELGIYTVQPGSTPHKLLDIPERAYVFDYALSPDGSQLAVLLSLSGGMNYQMMVVPISGDTPRELPKPADLNPISCIGWFDEAVSMSGAVDLCDKEWGEG